MLNTSITHAGAAGALALSHAGSGGCLGKRRGTGALAAVEARFTQVAGTPAAAWNIVDVPAPAPLRSGGAHG
ncbi:MAG: hypothetical protein Q4G67_00230 [Actinomycetia bacterium]|nr:hypothetical protein [Actinomycetes bacterium]